MGALTGVRVIEMAGVGPAPFATMLLADLGAEVITVERASDPEKVRVGDERDCTARGKRSIALNLKSPQGVDTLLGMIAKADMLVEGFRPGVMERLGLGPDLCLKKNPRLIYGRMTGWGQTGPLSQAAGHDINYIALTGALHAMGRAGEKPFPPLNLIGDYGGGSMFLIMGMLAALYEAQKSGEGQVVDAAMTDGSALLMAVFNSLHSAGLWKLARGVNMFDTGSHFYDTYETSDGQYVSVASIEPQFYAVLMEKAQLDPKVFGDQENESLWPDLKDQLAQVFKTKTRAEWCELMEGTDVCFAPVLDLIEAQRHPHNVERQTYIAVDGVKQPAPAPRFSRTVSEVQFGARARGEDTRQVLKDWGVTQFDIDQLEKSGVLT